MKVPTAIQFAEHLTFNFQSAQSVCEKDPEQAVYTLEAIVSILKKYGWPEPDFKGRAIQAMSPNDATARMRKIGKAIEEARLKKGLTVAQLAALTNKLPSAVARWESGTANLELSTMDLIEQYLPVKLLNL